MQSLKWLAGETIELCNLFRAQGPDEVLPIVTLLVTLVGTGLAMRKNSDMKALRDKATYVVAMVACGNVLSRLAQSIFILLPPVLREGLMLRYGSDEQKDEQKVREWSCQAQTMLKLSKIPEVLGS